MGPMGSESLAKGVTAFPVLDAGLCLLQGFLDDGLGVRTEVTTRHRDWISDFPGSTEFYPYFFCTMIF